MVKKPQAQKEQPDTEPELLDFDLEELAGEEGSAEDEVIELVELVEADQDEDKTGELAFKNRLEEKPPAKEARGGKPAVAKAPVRAMSLPAEDEEAELDLSDLTLDMDVEGTPPPRTIGEDEISESDLANLLKDTDSGEITFSLSSDQGGGEEGKDEEVTDADLEALLQEAAGEAPDEAKEEGEVLEIVSEAEEGEEVPVEEEKSSLTDVESLAESFEETQAVTEPLAEEKAPDEAGADIEKPLAPAETAQMEIPVETLGAASFAGVSEERLEEIITKVVHEVVERVTRETMASVAERVIGEAIEALRASLENSSDES